MYGNGAGWVDIDSDGDLDLYVTTVGDSRHYLYINQGGYFTEEAKQRGLSLEFESKRLLAGFQPTFGDYDRDGFLDVYTTEWILQSSMKGESKVCKKRLRCILQKIINLLIIFLSRIEIGTSLIFVSSLISDQSVC